tara:strand:- start:1693 stop:3570 length:1878 start_codon:yes stop_codon:yes gene_type:complete
VYTLIKFLKDLDRSSKTLILNFFDYALLVLSFELALSIRINNIYLPNFEALLLIFIVPLIAIPVFYFSGFYRSFIRYSSYQSLKVIMTGVSIYSLIWFSIVLFSGIIEKPFDFFIINWLLTVFFIGGYRFLARAFLSQKSTSVTNVLIYGAGSAGRKLQAAIKLDKKLHLIGFLDDGSHKQNLYLGDTRVYKSSQINDLINQNNIKEILVAMPSIERTRLQKILKSLKKYPVIIKSLPDISEILRGQLNISDLKTIRIEDLLKRPERSPDKNLMEKDIAGKNILVTGAGGSIGSEICRQVFNQKPSLLILFEINEHALYEIEKELLNRNPDFKIIAVLGNITNQERLEGLLKRYSVNTIYHTAAYKHVPMVEKNTIAALRCNIFGTLASINAALNSNVKSFIFISTDKAVRPTNIMGATKRFAEIILQTKGRQQYANSQTQTRVSIVRFGNVLGSSGSVVPLFKEQIESGGPLTVTDPNIIRYFMTISEAAQLVIQAGSMGSDGEIFLLDMGEPISILELAKDMIRLSGRTIRDSDNPNGDIEIQFTGLRPGEKLFEELLISGSSELTEHKKIMKANEKGIEYEELEKYLKDLKNAMKEDDYKAIISLFLKSVEGFSPSIELEGK